MTASKNYASYVRNNPFKVIVLIIILVIGYLIYGHEHSQSVAKQVYQEMVVIDQQLDQMQESANVIIAQHSTNVKLVTTLKGLTKDNFLANRANVIKLAQQLSYAPQVESNIINALNSANPSTYGAVHQNIAAQIRVLNYQHNLMITQFNQQIGSLTSQVANIKTQIGSISSDSLHGLELAKLRFISHKLAKTINLLNESLIQEILDVDANVKANASGVSR